jgi:hypothetical protein
VDFFIFLQGTKLLRPVFTLKQAQSLDLQGGDTRRELFFVPGDGSRAGYSTNGSIKRPPSVIQVPMFPEFEPQSLAARRLRRLTRPGKKVESQSTTSGPTGRLTLMVVPKRLNTLSREGGPVFRPVETPATCRWEGCFGTAERTATHVLGHNWTATYERGRESVLRS